MMGDRPDWAAKFAELEELRPYAWQEESPGVWLTDHKPTTRVLTIDRPAMLFVIDGPTAHLRRTQHITLDLMCCSATERGWWMTCVVPSCAGVWPCATREAWVFFGAINGGDLHVPAGTKST